MDRATKERGPCKKQRSDISQYRSNKRGFPSKVKHLNPYICQKHIATTSWYTFTTTVRHIMSINTQKLSNLFKFYLRNDRHLALLRPGFDTGLRPLRASTIKFQKFRFLTIIEYELRIFNTKGFMIIVITNKYWILHSFFILFF